jgi:hypothetical protein
MLTKESILQLLKTDKRAVARALVVLYERQTDDEKSVENTRYDNGRGFRPCHARMGSSMAKQFLRNGILSDKQINYWRVPDRAGNMRIGIYWNQLIEAAAQKKSQLPGLTGPAMTPAAVAMAAAHNQRDFGNDMEEKMVLQEMADGEQDPTVAAPLNDRISEIDEFWNKIREKK